MSPIKTTAVDPEDTSDAGFVSRWSRLKHAAAEDTEAATAGNITNDNAAAENSELEVKQESATRILTDEDMPDIESLTAESDYADFLSPAVSDKLRKLALRKLFLSEVFNIRDGLDEYDEDYTQFEKLGDIVTSDMRHQLELEAQREAQQLLQDQDPLRDDDCSDDAGVNAINKESDDQNIVAAVNTDTNSVQLDESQLPAQEETGDEAEDDAPCDPKAMLTMSNNHD